MSPSSTQLETPAETSADAKALELLRIWEGDGLAFFALRSGLWKSGQGWGVFLADLARLISEQETRSDEQRLKYLRGIVEGFSSESSNPTADSFAGQVVESADPVPSEPPVGSSNELPIPLDSTTHATAQEILRAWATQGRLCVSLQNPMHVRPARWGRLLFDAASHIANSFESDTENVRQEIASTFLQSCERTVRKLEIPTFANPE